MSIGLEDATVMLRRQLLAGEYPAGVKLRETLVAERLNVSRTIARLAMGELEHEGLLTRQPNRGSRIRAFSIDEVAQAIEVRGEMEAMAVRLVAERGLSPEFKGDLERLIAQGDALLEQGVSSEPNQAHWVEMNTRFHERLIEAAGNWALRVSIDQISRLPLVASGAIIFGRADPSRASQQLRQSHRDHHAILAAILRRQGHRAEALMREHAFRNAENKRSNLADPKTLAEARKLPGGSLVVVSERDSYAKSGARRYRRRN